MAVYRLAWDEPSPTACRNGMLALGNFDGVHQGHVSLLSALREKATQLQVPAVVMTFDPHPLLLLCPERFQPTLTTIDERSRLLQAKGADHVLILRTEPELLELSAAVFFDEVIRNRLSAVGMVEGPDFRFGHDREGNVETLRLFCAEVGMLLHIVPPLQLDGVQVSSSRIRQALYDGNVQTANRWLMRPYRLAGIVGRGQRRGVQLGFPTANLTQIATLIPGGGVYAVRAWYQGSAWPAAANIGPNPTFGEQAHKVEVHLIGFDGDFYGQELTIDFLSRLRDTQRFASVEQLLTQIRIDIEAAKRMADDTEWRAVSPY